MPQQEIALACLFTASTLLLKPLNDLDDYLVAANFLFLWTRRRVKDQETLLPPLLILPLRLLTQTNSWIKLMN